MEKGFFTALAVALSLSGCDRIYYEIKNTEASKFVAGVCRAVTRVPLPGQIEVCWEKSGHEVAVASTSLASNRYYQCMYEAGYAMNPAFADAFRPIYRRATAAPDNETRYHVYITLFNEALLLPVAHPQGNRMNVTPSRAIERGRGRR